MLIGRIESVYSTLPPIGMIYSYVKNDLNTQAAIRRIPPIILLHHHFININGFVPTYESVMCHCSIGIDSIGWMTGYEGGTVQYATQLLCV